MTNYVCARRLQSVLLLSERLRRLRRNRLPSSTKARPSSLRSGSAGRRERPWARVISRHFGNHIPGNPTVVVQHMPGSGGLLVANRLYNTAPKDGTAIGMINRAIPFEPLLAGRARSSMR